MTKYEKMELVHYLDEIWRLTVKGNSVKEKALNEYTVEDIVTFRVNYHMIQEELESIVNVFELKEDIND